MKVIRVCCILIVIVFFLNEKGLSQSIYQYPQYGEAIFKIKIPSDWNVIYANDPGRPANDHGEMILQPKPSGRPNEIFAATFRASPDPESETAVESIIFSGREFISSILSDVIWAPNVETIEINGIIFQKAEATGNFVKEDGSKVESVVALYFFVIDDKECLVLSYIASKAGMAIYGSEMNVIINTIMP